MKITLRKPKISDAESFREVFNDKEVVKQLSGYKYPLTLSHSRKQLEKTIKNNKNGDYYEFAIIADGKFGGMIVLEKPSKDKKTFTLGYAIGRKYWNKGITTEAIKQICNFGFRKLKLTRIIADNDEDNPASGRVLEKNGFKFIRKKRKRRRITERKVWVLYWEKFNPNISIKITKNKNLTQSEKDTINRNRVKEFGKSQLKDFKKDYEPETLWTFVKKKNKIVSLGGLRPIKIRYLGKTYSIGGICSTISIEKGKGYGKIMVSYMIDYSHKTGKTILGFTGREELKFFKKAGLGTKVDFIKRFVYINPKTKEKVYDNEGNGIYYEGRDKFISKVLSNKSIVYIDVLHW